MCDFIFEHRERQRKKHFCLLRCLSAFATPIKLYFRCVFKLLPYVALAFSLLRKVIIVIPMTYLLPYAFHMGTDGVFLAEPISNIIGGSLCFLVMIINIRKELRL